MHRRGGDDDGRCRESRGGGDRVEDYMHVVTNTQADLLVGRGRFYCKHI